MVVYKDVSASIAASGKSNVLAGVSIQTATYPRTVRYAAVVIQDNTPALGDVTWVLKIGNLEVARGRGVLARTAGGELIFPDDFDPIGIQVPPGSFLNLEVTNADSGGAHSVLYALEFDRY